MPNQRLTLFLLFLTLTSSYAQQHVQDSLRQLIPAARHDSNAVSLYYAYGETYEHALPDSALFYYEKAKKLAEQIGYKRGEAAFASYYIVILNARGKFREALNTAEEALVLYEQIGNSRELATAHINVGSEWEYLSDLTAASEYYLKALKFADTAKDLRTQRIALNNLGSVFIQLGDYEKGREYAEKALLLATELKNEYAKASSRINIATASMHLLDYPRALELYREVEKTGRQTNDDILLLDGWLGLADTYSAMQNEGSASKYYESVIAFATTKEAPEYAMYAHMGASDVFLRLNQPDKASSHITKGVGLALKMGSRLELKDLYVKASKMHEQQGNLAAALDFRKKFEVLNDSIVGEKSRTLVSNLEARYEFEKKESTIRQLKSESELQQLLINRKNLWNYCLVGSAAALLLLMLLGYRNYKNRQKIQQHRITELETEKKLSVTEAVLKGEEQERARLAKDLHDGLGGMLSGVKFSLNTMRGHLILKHDDALAFERSLDMLDTSIKEMRRVAHNMMPESLLKFGLNAALRDLCHEINHSGALETSYQGIGLEDYQPEQSVAIAIYRITQELLNNILKHAAAKSVIVQIARTDEVLSITVEDDGRGFGIEKSHFSSGIGWRNIRSRVEFVNGKIDVNTAPGIGTSVLVEIPV